MIAFATIGLAGCSFAYTDAKAQVSGSSSSASDTSGSSGSSTSVSSAASSGSSGTITSSSSSSATSASSTGATTATSATTSSSSGSMGSTGAAIGGSSGPSTSAGSASSSSSGTSGGTIGSNCTTGTSSTTTTTGTSGTPTLTKVALSGAQLVTAVAQMRGASGLLAIEDSNSGSVWSGFQSVDGGAVAAFSFNCSSENMSPEVAAGVSGEWYVFGESSGGGTGSISGCKVGFAGGGGAAVVATNQQGGVIQDVHIVANGLVPWLLGNGANDEVWLASVDPGTQSVGVAFDLFDAGTGSEIAEVELSDGGAVVLAALNNPAADAALLTPLASAEPVSLSCAGSGFTQIHAVVDGDQAFGIAVAGGTSASASTSFDGTVPWTPGVAQTIAASDPGAVQEIESNGSGSTSSFAILRTEPDGGLVLQVGSPIIAGANPFAYVPVPGGLPPALNSIGAIGPGRHVAVDYTGAVIWVVTDAGLYEIR